MVSWTVTRSPFCRACQWTPLQNVAQVRVGDGSYPVTGGLGDIFTDLLGRKTERTDLGRKGGRGTDLTSGGTEVDNLLLVGIELGSFTISYQHCRIEDVKTSESQSELSSHGSKR